MKCDIGFIDDDDHLVINNDLEAWGLIQNNKEKGCINVHIANDLKNAIGVHYRARFFGIDGIFLSEDTYENPDFATSFSHEVGHYFELDHTHQYSWWNWKCFTESISRTRTWPLLNLCAARLKSKRVCESTGDFLRDTPADHNLESNNSCNYTITGKTDPWGDHYDAPPTGAASPDTRNIMNYNRDRSCRTTFSRLQVAVMLHSIIKGKSKNNKAGWENLRAEYDEYEPDNNSLVARNIQLGEIQERVFHQQYTDEDVSGNPIWTSCDVDWVKFVAPCSNNFQVLTSEMAGRAHANTRLTLFNSSLTQLAQNDDISPADQFSSINWNFVVGQEYFIRVENLSPTLTGYYTLQIGGVITGASSLCTSGSYSFQNAPSGASFIWSAIPSGKVSINSTTGNPTTLTKTGNGNIMLTAQVTNFCGADFTAIKPISVGSPQPGPITFQLIDLTFGKIQATIEPVAGATSYNWYKNGVLHNTHHGTFAQIPISKTQCDIEYDISVAAVNSCGASGQSHANAYVPCDDYFRVSPNPAAHTITVSGSESKMESSVNKNIEEIYDLQGNLKKYQKFNKVLTANLSITGMVNGTYFIEIVSGAYKERHQLLIQR